MLFLPACLFAQNKQAAIWYVGKKKLDFNSDPVSVSSIPSLYGWHNATTIADKYGQLLFYFSGRSDKIYDRDLQPLPNGVGLAFSSPLFVPAPENENLYYLIDNFNYALIDVTLNKGNGDVIEKNIGWNTVDMKEIQAVHHSNCKDIWLLSQNDTACIAYLLTASGISKDPVVTFKEPSSAGFFNLVFSADANLYVNLGIKINGGSDTNFLTIAFGKFDRTTGVFNRTAFFQTSTYCKAFNCSFSPDNSKLYFNAQIRGSATYELLQIRIDNNVPDFDNPHVVSSYTVNTSLIPSGGMQIANDGKIYENFTFHKQINVINKPNLLGSACDYRQNDIQTELVMANLPKFISTWFSKTSCNPFFFYNNRCVKEAISFTIDNVVGVQSVLWRFGDGQTSAELAPTHIYHKAGVYSITLTIVFSDGGTKEIIKKIEVVEKPTKPIIIFD